MSLHRATGQKKELARADIIRPAFRAIYLRDRERVLRDRERVLRDRERDFGAVPVVAGVFLRRRAAPFTPDPYAQPPRFFFPPVVVGISRLLSPKPTEYMGAGKNRKNIYLSAAPPRRV
jgi:hypothetical protein